jgi:glutathione synthase/RimK-type ligase-like ATP-grasp enzyme
MTTVLLVTFDLMPDGEPGGAVLPPALAAHGIDARWVRWDDPAVDWAGADLVAVRSTWDYHRRLPAFLAWAREVEAVTTLLNGAEVFAWNADKAYLLELADVVPTVPTMLLDDTDCAGGLAKALARWGSVVVKPRTGAGGVGVVVVESIDDARLEGLVAGPWIAQPLVASVRTTGESSVYVLDGIAVAQVDKVAAAGEVRVHELYGGRSRPVALDPERAAVAAAAVRAAVDRRGADLAYARVDLMAWDGAWSVSELELIEPGLYLDVDPANADRFATLVAGRLARS